MAHRNLTGQVLYLYGISKGPSGKNAPVATTGIDGVGKVRALACGDFLCWVSEVERRGFADSLDSNMENLEWLALHGVRHQQVVAEIAGQGAIIPARFGTIFSGEPSLLKDVQGRKAALERVFSRIADADEWGVKVFGEASKAASVAAGARSGADYLAQKAANLKRRPDLSGLDEFAASLEKVATDVAPTGKVSGAQPSLLWQATFLVPRARRRQWDQTLNEFVKKWTGSRRIEVNGPWPPYSFVADAE